MKKVKTIKEQELTEIKSLVSQIQKVENDVLEFEFRKHHSMHLHAELNAQLDKAKKEIEANYGKINVNLETGEYTDIIEDAQVVK
jgi:hypothetical protein